MIDESALANLPGYELYRDGMEALRKGDFDTAPALLILMARTRLGKAGLPLPIPLPPRSIPAHLAFYGLLASQYPDPHFRYNAYLQRLEKFCRIVERQVN